MTKTEAARTRARLFDGAAFVAGAAETLATHVDMSEPDPVLARLLGVDQGFQTYAGLKSAARGLRAASEADAVDAGAAGFCVALCARLADLLEATGCADSLDDARLRLTDLDVDWCRAQRDVAYLAAADPAGRA